MSPDLDIDIIERISQLGGLGILLAFMTMLTFYLWRDLRSSWEQRIADNKHLVQVIEVTNKTYVALANSIDGRARAIEAISEAQTATAGALERNNELLRSIDTRSDLTEIMRMMERASIDATKLNNNIEKLLSELRT